VIGLGALLLAGCQSASIDPAEFAYYSAGADPGYESSFTPPPVSRGAPVIPAYTDLTPIPVEAAPPMVIRVQKGDSLYALSRKHLGSGARWREIADVNGLNDADVQRLAIGRELRLPRR
jgi:nucleoid-associated protein YgaU